MLTQTHTLPYESHLSILLLLVTSDHLYECQKCFFFMLQIKFVFDFEK
jgi:hypothetical protein